MLTNFTELRQYQFKLFSLALSFETIAVHFTCIRSPKNQYLTVMKRSELVEVQPQILQITVKAGTQTTQTLKVKNITSSSISNLFFCLFNQEKFEFSPDSFSLLPNEQKLVTIRLRTTSEDGMRRTSNKEFAYLKAAQVNIRITMLLKYDEEDQIGNAGDGYRYDSLEGSAPLAARLQFSRESLGKRDTRDQRDSNENSSSIPARNSETPTEQQINTLSSRAYRINQSAAFEKILSEKDEYINRLERDLLQRNDEHERALLGNQKQTVVFEAKIRESSLQIAALEGELRQVVKELRICQADLQKSKTSELTYKALYDKQKTLYTELKAQFERILSDKEVAQEKYEQVQQRLGKRQERIKELESVLSRMKEQIKSDNQRRVESLQSKLTQQRQLYENEFGNYQQRLKELELIAQNSEQLRQQSARFEQELIRKQQELKHAKSQVDTLRKSIRELENEKLAKVKLQVECSRMSESNQVLLQKAQLYEEQLEKQKQELYLYKSRVESQDNIRPENDKMSAYLEMALESSKKQNEILRRGKMEMEKSLMVYSANERLYRQKIELLEKERNRQSRKKDFDEDRIQLARQKDDQIVKLKEENVLLLERFQQLVTQSYEREAIKNPKFQDLLLQIKQRDVRINSLEHSLQTRMSDIQNLHQKAEQQNTEIRQLEKQKNRYKEDLRQDLTHINQSAMEQIRKLQAQKKKLGKRIAELEGGKEITDVKNGKDLKDMKDLTQSDNRLASKSKVSDERTNKYSMSRKSKHQTTTAELTPHSDKLQGIETQIIQMREQLHNFKESTQQHLVNPTNQLGQSRKTGIINQRRQVHESRNKSQSNIVMPGSLYDEDLHRELAELRQMEKVFENQQKRLRSQFNIQSDEDYYPSRGVFRVIGLFKAVQDALRLWQSKARVLENDIQNISIKIQHQPGAPVRSKQNQFRLANQSHYHGAPSNLNLSVDEKPTKLYEYLQEQMRIQFKRLNETIQLSHDKYDLLKRKVYKEYRSKLVDLIGKKDKTLISRIEQLLERFIDGLANTSHKEALLAKEIKKKLEFKKENQNLKAKVSEMNCLLSEKKGICSRDTVKIHHLTRPEELQIHEAVRTEAQLLSCQAENRRLTEQLALANENTHSATSELKVCVQSLQDKEDQILRLKSDILEIDKLHKQEVSQMISQMDVLRAQYLKVDQLEQQVVALMSKEKECTQLKKQLGRKKQLIESLKEKEKVLLDTIQNLHKQYEEDRPKIMAKERVEDSNRMQQTLSQLRQKNRQLKAELERRQDGEKKLLQELDRKVAYINSIKPPKTPSAESPSSQQQQLQVVRLNSELKQVQMRLAQTKSSNTKLHSTIDNLKTKLGELEKQLTAAQNELRSSASEWSIKEKSLTSILRSIVEMLRRLWRLLEIKVKKLHPSVQTNQFDALVKDIMKVDMIRLYDGFEALVKQAIGE